MFESSLKRLEKNETKEKNENKTESSHSGTVVEIIVDDYGIQQFKMEQAQIVVRYQLADDLR